MSGTADADADAATPCSTCAAGTSSGLAQTTCNPCSSGRADLDKNATTPCDMCSAGTYAPAGGVVCGHCAAGSADKDGDAATACAACRPGQYAGIGATVCVDCVSGTADADADAATPCTPCAKGTFSDRAQTLCQLCAKGRADADGNATTACTSCGSGTFAPLGAQFCVPCVAGTADTDEASNSSCLVCNAGRFASTGGTICSPCAAGKHDDDADPATPCTACAPTRQSRPATTVCSDCPAGSEPNVDQTACAKCASGKQSTKGTLCEPCGATEMPSLDQTSCVPCGAHEIYTQGLGCTCIDDYYNSSHLNHSDTAVMHTVTCVDSLFLDFTDVRAVVVSNVTCQECGPCLRCRRGEAHTVEAQFSLAPNHAYTMFKHNKTLSQIGGNIALIRCPLDGDACPGELAIQNRSRMSRLNSSWRPRYQSVDSRVEGGDGDGDTGMDAPISLCGVGHRGPLCAVCAEGYRITRQRTCKECEDIAPGAQNALTWYMVIMAGIISLVGALVYFCLRARSQKRKEKEFQSNHDAEPDLLSAEYVQAMYVHLRPQVKILVSLLQVVTLMGPSNLQSTPRGVCAARTLNAIGALVGWLHNAASGLKSGLLATAGGEGSETPPKKLSSQAQHFESYSSIRLRLSWH